MLKKTFISILCSLSHYAYSHLLNPPPYEDFADSPSSKVRVESFANTECEPTARVEGVVCVITGDFIESQTDLVLQGVEPIELRRCYSSQAPEYTNLHDGWSLNHHGKKM